MDFDIPIILGRSFLATGRALVNVECRKLTVHLNTEEVKFNMCVSIKRPKEVAIMSIMDVEDACLSKIPIEVKMSMEALVAVLMSFPKDAIDRYKDTVHALQGRGTRPFVSKKLDLDLNNRATLPAKPSIEEPPVMELKEMPQHLRYAFFWQE